MDAETNDRSHPDETELDAFRSGETDAQVTKEVTAHLATCSSCRDRLTELEELAAALLMPVEPAEIPAGREAAILDIAAQAGRQIRARKRRFYAVPLLAVAAALVLVVSTWSLLTGSDSRSSGGEQLAVNKPAPVKNGAEDLNADGVIDVIDAFMLARTVRDQGELPSEWDFNGDGTVDEADAAWLGQSAVTVSGGVP